MDNLNNLVTEVETFVGAGVAIAAILGWKGFKTFSLKKAAKKTAQVAQNLEELTEDSLSNIISNSVSYALHEFAVDQAKRDTALWQSHNDCHERIEQELKAIKDNQNGIVTQLIAIGSEVSNLRGRIEGQG